MKHIQLFENFLNEAKAKYTIDQLKTMFKKISDDPNITTRVKEDCICFINDKGDRMKINIDGTAEDTIFGSATSIINVNKFKIK